MSVSCPHCKNSIDAAPGASGEVVCDSCGAGFALEREVTAEWRPVEELRAIGKFELRRLVGSGAFGSVFQALDKELGRTVAVKIPRSGGAGSSGESDRFLREARSVAQLRHPAIVPVFEIGQQQGMPYLVSEFVDGITLADLLTSERPSPRAAADMVAEIAAGLEYAHQQGVVHRDVKPSNIMLEVRGKELGATESGSKRYAPRLMDFGLAKRDQGDITMTTEGEVLGTPAYMSPEQARGESHAVDRRCDVYSLGVVLYQLLTAELPFQGNARMMLHQLLNDEPKPPRQRDRRIPKDLETICLKAMAKEPARRYATAGEMANDLRSFLRGEPICARPSGWTERVWRWGRRNPAIAGLSAVVLLLAAGLAWIVISRALTKPYPDRPAPLVRDAGPQTDDLLQVIAQLDKTDPGWRLDQIELGRKAYPDDQNSAPVIRKAARLVDVRFLDQERKVRIRDLVLHRGLLGDLGQLYPELTEADFEAIGKSRDDARKEIDAGRKLLEGLDPRAPPGAESSAKLAALTADFADAIGEALRLKDFPQGRHSLVLSHDAVATRLPHIDDVIIVGRLLDAEAVLRSSRGETSRAFASCMALLNLARSLGDEAFFISQTNRSMWVSTGIAALERILAEGELTDSELARAEDWMRVELDHAPLAVAARGERASMHWLFSSIEAGDLKSAQWANDFNLRLPTDSFRGPVIRPAHAWILRYMTRMVELSGRPMLEQVGLARQWANEVKLAPDAAKQWLEAMTGKGIDYSSILNGVMFRRAGLIAAKAAVAVERYRLAHRAWPRDLEALVPNYWSRTPKDPYSGKDLFYKQTDDGVILYGIGSDRVDQGGKLNRSNALKEGTDIGFQLWNAEQRKPFKNSE